MHGSALPPSVPPISTACGICGKNMRLACVDPTGTDTVYAYRCDGGHYHEILRAGKRAASVVDLTIVEPVAGEVPPSKRPEE
jgi:hypothetical protein